MLRSLDFRLYLKASKPNRFQAFAVNPRRFLSIFSLDLTFSVAVRLFLERILRQVK